MRTTEIDALDPDVLQIIFEKLELKDLLRVLYVSKDWYQISSSINQLWAPHLLALVDELDFVATDEVDTSFARQKLLELNLLMRKSSVLQAKIATGNDKIKLLQEKLSNRASQSEAIENHCVLSVIGVSVVVAPTHGGHSKLGLKAGIFCRNFRLEKQKRKYASTKSQINDLCTSSSIG